MMRKKMDRISRRRFIGWLLSAATALLLTSEPVRELASLPDSIQLTRGYSASLDLPWPLQADVSGDAAVLSSIDETLNDVSSVRLSGTEAGSASVTLRLMGILPVRSISVSVEEERILIPGGAPIGVAIRTNGVLVIGASDLGGSTTSPAREAGLLPGDVIQAVDGVTVTGARQLSSLITSNEKRMLTVLRNDETLTIPLTPTLDPRDGAYRLGVWVRDSTAGIGTLSFYDPSTKRFGALGHAITDIDTGLVLDVQQGEIVESTITEIRKGERGTPGELVGQFSASAEALGSVDINGSCGIYGGAYQSIENTLYPDGLPIAYRSETHTGSAQILTTLDDSGVHAYDCEIVKLTAQSTSTQRSMVIQITDPALLEKTGGIVQGMSGSPIIQDGKLVGAVTHVLINDPSKGYGIFIENMLDAAG